MYAVLIPKKVEKELSAIPTEFQKRIFQELTSLKTHPKPHNSKLLKGKLSGLWRIRIGSYRLIYEIYETKKHILIVKIGPRKDIYR